MSHCVILKLQQITVLPFPLPSSVETEPRSRPAYSSVVYGNYRRIRNYEMHDKRRWNTRDSVKLHLSSPKPGFPTIWKPGFWFGKCPGFPGFRVRRNPGWKP